MTALGLLALSRQAAWAQKQQTDPPPVTSEINLVLDPAQSKVRWTLGSTFHTVHGTFALKEGALRLDTSTGKAEGEFVVDAASGTSGNTSRDKKMHREVLESERYREVVFRPDRVQGKVTQQGAINVQVHGIFVLHGTEHELSIPVQAELTDDHWKGAAKFSVPFVEWGLKNPSNFLLRVDHAVEIEVDMGGSLRTAPLS